MKRKSFISVYRCFEDYRPPDRPIHHDHALDETGQYRLNLNDTVLTAVRECNGLNAREDLQGRKFRVTVTLLDEAIPVEPVGD